jgi:acetolactate synthase regulatory subunit
VNMHSEGLSVFVHVYKFLGIVKDRGFQGSAEATVESKEMRIERAPEKRRPVQQLRSKVNVAAVPCPDIYIIERTQQVRGEVKGNLQRGRSHGCMYLIMVTMLSFCSVSFSTRTINRLHVSIKTKD